MRALSFAPPPLGAGRQVITFAAIRVLLALTALASLAFVDVPNEGRMVVVGAAIGVPWTLAVLVLAVRAPRLAVNPVIALGDFAVLAVGLVIEPALYGAMRFLGLWVVAAHAHFQGERRGLLIAAVGAGALIGTSEAVGEPVRGGLDTLYELLFALSALATAGVVGRLRTAETEERRRAEEAARRTLQAENEVRRRVAVSIHDGPVQELVSLDMALAAAEHEAREGHGERAAATLGEARRLARHTVDDLRGDLIALGHQPANEVGLHAALERAAPLWRRRYGFALDLDLAPLELEPTCAGALFGIAQEAVVNAGRHAEASRVVVRLGPCDEGVELSVSDDGRGFPAAASGDEGRAGHLGLESMRERAEMLDGELRIESDGGGSAVIARAPLGA